MLSILPHGLQDTPLLDRGMAYAMPLPNNKQKQNGEASFILGFSSSALADRRSFLLTRLPYQSRVLQPP